MSTGILLVCIIYSMFDLLCNVISCCAWSYDTGKKIKLYDNMLIQNMKKEKIWYSKKFLRKSPSKNG